MQPRRKTKFTLCSLSVSWESTPLPPSPSGSEGLRPSGPGGGAQPRASWDGSPRAPRGKAGRDHCLCPYQGSSGLETPGPHLPSLSTAPTDNPARYQWLPEPHFPLPLRGCKDAACPG